MFDYKFAYVDIKLAFSSINIWFFMALEEIRQRYRRSILGPAWITISTSIVLLAMGPLYSKLLGIGISEYFRNLSVGLIIWNYITGCINDSTQVFITSEGYIKNIKLPYSLYILKVISKNIIIFLHNIVIIFAVLYFFPVDNGWYPITFILGFLLTTMNLFWISLLIGMITARYRDFSQLVANILQLFFFITPIIWTVNSIIEISNYVKYNPFYYFIESMRAPLISNEINFSIYLYLLILLFFGMVISFLFFSKYRRKIIYWL